MPAEFKSLSLNNLLKLQQQHQQNPSSSSSSSPSQLFAHESLFKPYHVLQQQSTSSQSNVNAIMTELNNSGDSVIKSNNCNNNSEEDSNSNDSELSVGQEKVQNEVKDSPQSDDDEMSNASSSQYTTNSSTRLCSPTTTMRPGTSLQFHEEILRSSQLYAEELLRQRIAAAARLQGGISGGVTDINEPEPSIISKLSFQTSLFGGRGAASSTDTENGNSLFCAKSAINFQNIHSHLSSIAQITQNLSGGGGSGHHNNNNHHQQLHQHGKKDDASLSSLSRESSQSPSGFQQQFKMQQHNHHHHHHQKLNFHTPSTHQNQLHEHNLKFSIDNILKADFGRRITEPLLKSSKAKRALRDGKHEKDKVNFFLKRSNNNKNNNANGSNIGVEGQQSDKSLDQSFPASSTATTTTGENASSSASTKSSKSDSGTVWPAWVSFFYPSRNSRAKFCFNLKFDFKVLNVYFLSLVRLILKLKS